MYVHDFNRCSEADVCDSPCYNTNEVVIQLYEYRDNREDNAVVCSKAVLLQNDELYRTEVYISE